GDRELRCGCAARARGDTCDAPSRRRDRRLAGDRVATRRGLAFARRVRGVVVVSGPLDRREPGEVASQVREATTWLVDLLFERTDDAPAAATAAPIAARRCRLAAGRRIGFVSLVAGCGTTTTAAL